MCQPDPGTVSTLAQRAIGGVAMTGLVPLTVDAGGVWGAATTHGRGTAHSPFQEVLSLDVGSGSVARAVWKNAKTGTQTMGAS